MTLGTSVDRDLMKLEENSCHNLSPQPKHGNELSGAGSNARLGVVNGNFVTEGNYRSSGASLGLGGGLKDGVEILG
jgi:hypothetical protein